MILEVGCGLGIDALITSGYTDCTACGIDLSYWYYYAFIK